MAQILWFQNYSPADAPVLGGKNASLGTLMAAGLPVPPGSAISADCYREALADGGLTGQPDALIAAADPHDPASVAAAGAQARSLIGSLAASGDLADAIRAAYARLCERLCERCGDGHLPVAVRSSATCEDRPDASFAGEHDTYLWCAAAIRSRPTCSAAGQACSPTAASPTGSSGATAGPAWR